MDAYRIASRYLWDAAVHVATVQPGFTRDVLIRATRRFGVSRTSTQTQ